MVDQNTVREKNRMHMRKILIVDDDMRLRQFVRELFSPEEDLQIIGEAVDGQEAIHKAQELQPGLVLMDITMPRMNGLDATRQLKKILPELVIIILTIHDLDEYRKAAIASGASAYVVKKAMMAELLPAVRMALSVGVKGMKDTHKTKDQLIGELTALRQRSAAMQAERSDDRKKANEQLHKIAECNTTEHGAGGKSAFLKCIFEGISDGLSVLDTELTIVRANTWMETMYAEDAPLEGKKCYSVYQKRNTPCPRCPSKTGEAHSEIVKNPSEENPNAWIDLSAYPLRDDEGRIIGVIEHGKDITARKQTEAALMRSERELRVRNRIADIFLATPDDELSAHIVRIVLEAMESNYGIFGYSAEDGSLVCTSMKTDTKGQYTISTSDEVVPPETWEGIWGRALIEKKILHTNKPFSLPQDHIPLLRALDAPIIFHGKAIGNLLVGNKKTDYDENDRKMLETIADGIAPILNARLQRDREEKTRGLAEDRITHLNAVLYTLRNVNHIMVTERDRERLVKRVCEALIETRGYHNAWIALFDESRKPATIKESGLGEAFVPMAEKLKGGALTHCAHKALSQSSVEVIAEPLSTCTDCPLARMYAGRAAMTVRLEYGGKVYGLLSVSIPVGFATDEEEQSLLKELSEDIAFALHSIEAEDERTQAEKAIQESRERYRGLVETMTDIVFTLDVQGRFTYLNPEAERIAGYKSQEFIGHPFTKILAPEYRASTVDRFKRGLSGKTIPIYEVALLHKDGTKISVELNVTSLLDAEGKTMGRIGIARNITERKRAEEALKESEERYRSLFNRLTVGVFQSTPDGRFIDANPAFTKLLGCPDLETLLSNHVANFYRHPEEREQWKKFIEKEGGSFAMELQWQKLDGTPLWVRESARVVRDRQGRVRYYEGVAEDITEKKRVEEEQKSINAKLQQAQRMESIGALAGGIAHDFNNILSAIIGYTEIALFHEFSESSPARQSLEQVLVAGKRAKNLVKQILTFSRQAEDERRSPRPHPCPSRPPRPTPGFEKGRARAAPGPWRPGLRRPGA